MALTEAFWKEINEKNIIGIHIMMKNSMLGDTTFKEFHQMEEAAKDIEGLYDKHDGSLLNEDKSTWNNDYLDLLMVQLMSNFSHERIEHLKKMVRYLYPPKESEKGSNSNTTPKYTNITGQSDYQRQKSNDIENGTFRKVDKKSVGIGAGIGLAVGACGSAIAGATLGVGVLVAAAGTVTGAGIGYAVYKSKTK